MQGSLTVTLPPRLELHCPDLAVTNQRLDIRLVSWGSVGVAVDWSITKIDIQIAEGTRRYPSIRPHCIALPIPPLYHSPTVSLPEGRGEERRDRRGEEGRERRGEERRG